MQRILMAAVIGVAALVFASAAQAFQCPKLVKQINDAASNRLDAAAYDARAKATETETLHKAGKHAEAEKAGKEGLKALGIQS